MEIRDRSETDSLQLKDLFKDSEIASFVILFSPELSQYIQISSMPDCTSVWIGSNFNQHSQKFSLDVEFEPKVLIEGDVELDQMEFKRFTSIFEWVFKKEYKYRLASEFHKQIVASDFEQLQHKNQQLKKSQALYRNLSISLETQVNKQVKQIEHAQNLINEQERLATVGFLAAGVAHEINNPLGYIESNLRTAESYLTDLNEFIYKKESDVDVDVDELFSDFNDLLDESQQGCQRISSIVKDLKDFSDQPTEHYSSIKLDNVLEDLVADYSKKFPTISWLVNLEAVEEMQAKRENIKILFRQLFDNSIWAVKYTDKKRISIRTFYNNNNFHIQIFDTGCGMDVETRKHAFDPFFTTKDINEGKGLGLTVCRDIVKAHHGTIDINAAPGSGTMINISFSNKDDA